MLMAAQPVYDAYQAVINPDKPKPRTIYVTPQGPTFNQEMAKEFAKEEELVILCGHYEGIDERVLEEIVTDYVSIGDYVLTGGELGAMVMIDSIVRLLPGVLGNEDSPVLDSYSSGLLEHPHYTRPYDFRGMTVPDTLMSGNHKHIEEWRRKESLRRTWTRRPDLLEQMELTEQEKKWLDETKNS